MGRVKCAILSGLSLIVAGILALDEYVHYQWDWADVAKTLHTGYPTHEFLTIMFVFFGFLLGILAAFPGRSG